MSTLPPPFTNEFAPDTLEKQIYNLIDSFAEYIPVPNDRNRLSFSLFKYLTGEGDEPLISIKAAKLTIKGISQEDLAKKIEEGIAAFKK